jgi:sialate O-acetylesterase
MFRAICLALFASLATCAYAVGAVSLGSPFSDDMVVQRGQDISVWGKAADGEVVTVEFRGAKVSTAAKDGKWSLRIPSGDAGGPFEMTVKGQNEIRVKNVLVGEVWLASGQSNMSYLVQSQNVPPEQLAAAQKMAADANPAIRFFMVKGQLIDGPLDNVLGQWSIAVPDNVGKCSAVAWYFAVRLHEKLNVPIGLVIPAVGGTPVEMWISRETLDSTSVGPAIWKRHEERLKKITPAVMEKYKADVAAWQKTNNTPELRRENQKSFPREPSAPMPCHWYNTMVHGLEPFTFSGIIWFQADGNAGFPSEYSELIKALVTSWRKSFQAELPFYYVEMNNMWEAQAQPVEYGRNMGLIREAQEGALDLPKTGVVAAIDLCIAHDNPHFPNKKPVGDRLANLALEQVYGLAMGEVNSPAFAGFAVEGNKVRLRFNYAEGLRTCEGGPLKGFAIRGAQGGWLWADGKIKGNDVVVWNGQISEPAAVRYAWATFPIISVENAAGLPMRPFRTDKQNPR